MLNLNKKAEDLTQRTVLVVEDDVPILDLLIEKLNKEGFRTLQARDGEQALTVADKERPDLILLDIILPKLDGLKMMEKLRTKNDWGKKIPIILLTNLSLDDQENIKKIITGKPAYYLVVRYPFFKTNITPIASSLH